MTDALNQVEHFVSLQRSLVRALEVELLEGASASERLFDVPRTGSIGGEVDEWTYACHGAGIRFRHARTGEVVDIPERLDRPDLFEAWRLSSHFRSLGGRGVKLVARAVGRVGLPVDRGVAILLDTWTRARRVIAEDARFRLADPGESVAGEFVYVGPSGDRLHDTDRDALRSIVVGSANAYWKEGTGSALLQHVSRARMLIAHDAVRGLYLRVSASGFRGGDDLLSVRDGSRTEDESADGSYFAGLFLPKEIAWTAIETFTHSGRASTEVQWIRPAQLPEGARW